MLQTILIGPAPDSQSRGAGGIGQFILFILHYRSLLLRLGAAAAVSIAFEWLGWPVVAKLGFLAVEIYASLLVIRVFAGASQRGQLGRILTAMWVSIAVLAIATYLLFVNDQGRELGVGLMDLSAKGPLLGLVLIYWALNNWLSARVGLARAFPEPEKDQVLLFWGPRLIGVLAHLLAAFSLSAAALSQHDLQGKIEPWLVFAAPLAILLAITLGWFFDKGCLSKRLEADERRLARKQLYVVAGIELLLFLLAGLTYARSKPGVVPPGLFWGTLSIACSAFVFLGLISWLRSKAPLGKAASAEERERDDQSEQNQTTLMTLGLALVMLIGAGTVWVWPMQIGHFFGSLIIACFSFGSVLALTNLLELLARWLMDYAKKAGFSVGPRAFAAAFVCFLVIPAVLASLTHSFHRVRLCKEKDCTAVKIAGWSAVESPAKRPTASEAALAWYAQAEPVYHSIHPNEPVPMLIVATAGGGIRAAYWTATILEKLESDLRWEALGQSSRKEIPTENLMRNLLFAISGVSGGSVGAAAYAAAVQDHAARGTGINPTKYLQEDFLAPGLASMVFVDGPSNLLPDLGQIDRGQALELGFELASRTDKDKEGLVSHKFLSFFPAMNEASKPGSWRPALLFNATHQETGRRMITSHIKIERDIFLDSYDALQALNSDVRLSTAAHNSARFTYISPAGNLMSAEPSHNRGYVIDGGYFENYGAQTALELAREAIDAIDPQHKNKVKLVVLQISSDPALQDGRTLVRVGSQDNRCAVSSLRPAKTKSDPTDPANYLEMIASEGEGYVLPWANELSAPLVGIMSVRQAHGTIAAAELAASICTGEGEVEQALQDPMQRKTAADASGRTEPAANTGNDAPHFSHMAMCEISWNGGVGVSPPLGWVLSDRTRLRFADILKDCGNRQELIDLERALGLPISTSSGATTNHAANTAR
jgi:hypothetical protein